MKFKGLIFISLLVSLTAVYTNCLAQIKEDALHTNSAYNTSTHFKEKAIEIYKVKSNKTFQFKKGHTVYIRCANQEGKFKIKRTQIVNIGEHDIIFKPYNDHYKEVTCSESEIMYIGFTSTGRIIFASVSNIMIVSTVMFIYLIAVIPAMLTGNSLGDPDFRGIPLVPFRKDISFYKSIHGERIWALRIVEIQ